MTTQSITSKAPNLFGNVTGSSAKQKQSGNCFDLIMDSSLKSLQKNPGNNSLANSKKSDVAEKSDMGYRDESKMEPLSGDRNQTKVASQEISSGQTKELDAGKGTLQAQGAKDEPEIDSEVLAQISSMLQMMKEAVMKTLNLTSEELDQLLKDQGMSITDLLQPESLQQLVLASSGESDLLAVLTKENLATSMNELLQTLDQIKEMSGLELTKEQIDELLIKAEAELTKPLSEELEQNALSGDNTVTTNANENSPNVVSVKDNSNEENQVVKNADNLKYSQVGTQTEQTNESSFGNMQDHASEEQNELSAENHFQAFVENLVGNTKEIQAEFGDNVAQAAQIRDIADQIISRIKVVVSADQSSMELQLNPEHLGKVNLTVQSKNGMMTAQFVVQNEISKEAIESQLHTLKETLNQQGIKVEAIEVTVSSYTFEQESGNNSQNQTETKKQNSGKQITLEEAINMTDVITEDENAKDMIGVAGSQIDYTA